MLLMVCWFHGGVGVFTLLVLLVCYFGRPGLVTELRCLCFVSMLLLFCWA